tara:strand:- start:660 stop:854 length:195 start_codon:yes stop_codon:yes gene_type:complete
MDYTNKTERDAVQDCLSFLGSKKFKSLVSEISKHNDKTIQFIIIDIFGIKGYPANAMVNRYTNV